MTASFKIALVSPIVLGLAFGLGCNNSEPIIGESRSSIPEPKSEANAPAETKTSDPMNASFAEATVTDEIPDGQEQPPDVLLNGKPTAVLRLQVEKIWKSIALTDSMGKPLPLKATVRTEAGEFVIELNPALAPNHVRNFLALAKIGYFEGLQFERTIHQVSDEDAKIRLDMVKFGCPVGTGERGRGHIGYFIRPEFSETVKHEVGTVGFWHDEDPGTAGCRLYITLNPAPALDGEFTIIGKVTRGLDIVSSIANRPVINTENYPEKEIPRNPIKIQQVTFTADR